MAAESPVESLREEATCPVCLEYFTDPVVTACGHNFCRACLSRCWEGPGLATSCPQCRETVQQRNFRPNRQLANMVELVKRLNLQAPKGAGGDGVCGEHQEALKLFCHEDQTSICVICHLSQAHRTHWVVPIQEAAQQYKAKCQAHLKTLREEREKLLGQKVIGEGRSHAYLKQTQAERQKIVAEFQQLRQFLEEQERLLLAQLEKLDKEIGRLQTDTVGKLSAQISHLSEQIGELEGKCQKPASEFLQDVRSTLGRCEKGRFQQPVELSPPLENKLRDFSQKTVALMETLRKFKATLPSALQAQRRESLAVHSLGDLPQILVPPLEPHLLASFWVRCVASEQAGTRQAALEPLTRSQPSTVTLDPDTAHPDLALSEDRKSVRWERTQQSLPNNPERFNLLECVLGSEGFNLGRHCWEVEVKGKESWAVGVARESVRRKGWISISPQEGIWAVQQFSQCSFQALTSPVTCLPLSLPSRIRVCLDCDRRQVTFIDAGSEAPIFTFPPGSLPGERIRPWLWVSKGTRLRLCP